MRWWFQFMNLCFAMHCCNMYLMCFGWRRLYVYIAFVHDFAETWFGMRFVENNFEPYAAFPSFLHYLWCDSCLPAPCHLRWSAQNWGNKKHLALQKLRWSDPKQIFRWTGSARLNNQCVLVLEWLYLAACARKSHLSLKVEVVVGCWKRLLNISSTNLLNHQRIWRQRQHQRCANENVHVPIYWSTFR